MTRGHGGFTLAEILVALVVLSAGVLGVSGTLVYAARTLHQARDLEWAVQEARALADSLAHFGAVGDGWKQLPFGRLSWTVQPGTRTATVRIVALHDSGRHLVDVTTLAPTSPGDGT